ncbi:hypothetical protein JCM10296v2_004547 [Rhodotorula toruloides]
MQLWGALSKSQGRRRDRCNDAIWVSRGQVESPRATQRRQQKDQQQQRPKCKFCQGENPRHSVERCWQNPDNPNNCLNQSVSSKGKGKEKSKKDDRKDKDGKVVTLAVATVASSVDGVYEGSKAPPDWHLDTCASRHIVAERCYFISYRLSSTPIVTASGPSLKGVGVGTAEIEVETSSGRFKLQLKDAIHVPTSSFNLISAPRFINGGYKLEFAPGGAVKVVSSDDVRRTVLLRRLPEDTWRLNDGERGRALPGLLPTLTLTGQTSLVVVEPVLSDKSSPFHFFFANNQQHAGYDTHLSEAPRHPYADELSSASEHGSPTPSPYSRMAPASTVVAAPAYQPGKAPYLLDDSPAGLASFSRAAGLFFHAKSVKDDALKVAYVGGGLVGFPELYNWYLSSATEHEAKTYDSFWADLSKRALPRDYVWDAKGRIRWAKQGDEDYEVWSSSLRTEHLQLTDKVMPTRDFIECLLYGMDPELSTLLRRGTFLRNSGFHEDDLSLIAPSTSTLAFTAPLNYDKFDRKARDEWNKIAVRRRSNAAQIRSLSRKAAAITVSNPSKSNGPAKTSSGTTTRSSASSAMPQTASGGGGRPPKLTEQEKDWLSANNGCFRCRRINIDHDPKQCTDWASANYVIKVPQGWEKDKPVPASVPSSTNASISTGSLTVGLAAIYQDDDKMDLPESFADDSDTDGCTFPPLHLRVAASRGGRSVMGLADSGSSVSLISDKLAAGLGLERFSLSKPKRVRLAIQGEGDLYTITHFVRCGVALENGTWGAGATTLLVAPLGEPFGVILGVPFLKRHRLSLTAHPEPAILVDRGEGKEPYDLLAPAYRPATAFQTLASIEGEEKAAFISTVAEACAFGLIDQAQALM